MSYNKLPADPTAMILGIVALVVSFVGCCCGIFAVIPVVLSIIGLVMANKSLREYQLNPIAFNPQSRSNVYTAKVINIIALVLGALVMLFYIAYFALYGVMFSQIFKEAYEARKNGDNYHYEWENDSLYYGDDDYIIENDSIHIDSIRIDETEMLEIETPLDSLN
ncbi:hypothetical protein A9Q86_14370 [Flavobacteriales bacterium 33_180_T64]|nr:hypothetical protein A9Q86_14370 [Flavobacteriales bacterium 33_180_T64]